MPEVVVMWIRMQVRFHASDNESLARDLTRYDKGQRRIARLMTLATYGLIYLRQVARDGNAIMLPDQEKFLCTNDTDTKPLPPPGSYEYNMTTDDLGDVFGD